MSKIQLLYLIIYISFSSELFCQNLTLTINGENEVETRIIDSLGYQKNHIDYLSLKKEVDTTQLKLFKTGYIENKITILNRKSDSTFSAKIELKNKYNYIYIYYNKDIVDKAYLNLISNTVTDDYFILSMLEVENALDFINSKIVENGLPFSSLKLSEIKIADNKNLKANLFVSNKEKKRIINKIIVKGYEKFPKSFIRHFLKIREGELFNINAIKDKSLLLNDIKFARQLRDPEVLFKKDSTELYLYLEKTKSNSFDGFLGFGTNENTGNIDFNGYLNLNLVNNLNYGESFKLYYKSDENDQKTFNLKLDLPYIAGTAIGTELGLRIFKRDSSFTTTDQSTKLFYQVNSKNKVLAGITSTQSNNLLSESNTSTQIQDYDALNYTLGYEYIKPQYNDLLFPINFYAFLEGGFGNRKITSTKESQNSYILETYKIFNLNLKNSIYLRVNSSGLFSDNYQENELKRFGGINSIRGFEENSLTANLYSVINSEYRFRLNRTIFVHTIIDFAYLENDIIDQKEKLFGFGFGFGLSTKAGLFKFNYANGKNQNQAFKLSDSKIHISLTALF